MALLSYEELREQLARALPDTLVEQPLQLPPVPTVGHGPKAEIAPLNGLVVVAERIVEAALYLRDTLGYAFLSDIAVVDYLAAELFELVYRFYNTEGGGSVVLKVRLPRANPTLPSLTPHWPGANFHEREAFDLYGIDFAGHPYLRRIYMWDEFEGFPMRKDFPKQGDKYIGEDE
jgi:NADH-quinone oxidoreductase subunit C